MKKLLLSFALIAGLGLAASAQKEGAVHKVSVGGEFIYPLGGSLKENYSYGFGGSVMGEYNILKHVNLTVSGAYTSLAYTQEIKDYFAGSIIYSTKNVTVYPVKAGVKYYHKNLYGAIEVGGTFSTKEDSATALAYSGGVGTTFSISPKSSLDFGVRYEEWNLNGRDQFVGLRVAYAFGL